MHIPDLVGWKCRVEVEVHRSHGPGVPVPGAVELRVLRAMTSSHHPYSIRGWRVKMSMTSIRTNPGHYPTLTLKCVDELFKVYLLNRNLV